MPRKSASVPRQDIRQEKDCVQPRQYVVSETSGSLRQNYDANRRTQIPERVGTEKLTVPKEEVTGETYKYGSAIFRTFLFF